MSRYFHFMLVVLFVSVISSQPAPVEAQEQREIQIETTPLGENVYMLSSHAGGNVGAFVSEDGVVLIDSDYAGLHRKVADAISKLSDKPVHTVINTHWHFDHVQGNVGFAEKGSRIIAHKNVRERMAVDQRIDILDYDVPASPAIALPTLVYESSMTLYQGDERIRIIHAPHAHTDGDSIVFFEKANVVHAGDLFFNCGYPFIDATNGGNIDGMIAAIEKVLTLCDEKTRIIPGHGPLASKPDVETYLTVLRDFRAIVAAEMKKGKDMETIQTEKPTAELDEKWGKLFFPPELFTEMVYLSLSKK